MTKQEQRAWIKLHWSGLVKQGKLSEALRRYFLNGGKQENDAIYRAKEVFDTKSAS